MALGAYNEALINAASLDQVKAWLAGSVGTDSLPAKPRPDDVDRLYLDNADTVSGNALQVVSTITTSNVIDISATALTTGKGIDMSDLNAITTGKALHIDATGVTQTDGILVHIDSASTALTATGRLLLVDHTGTAGVSTIIAEIKSAATDETVIAQILASAALAAGKILNISGASMTTGKGIAMDNLNALTTGIGLSIVSSATAITGVGRLLYVNHTGLTGTNAVLNEFKSDATDETTILRVSAADVLALGVAFDITASSMTTGTALDIGDLDALTTGKGINVASNSADTGASFLVDLLNDHASATGRIPLRIRNDSTGNDIQVINRHTAALGAKIEMYHNPGNSQAADNDVTGRILFAADDEEAAATKRTVGQIDCLWTDSTAASFASRFIIYTSSAAAQNEAVRILDTGQIEADLGGGAGNVTVFDEYDDAAIIQQFNQEVVSQQQFLEQLERMGIASRKNTGSGWMLNLHRCIFLAWGGIAQTRQRVDEVLERMTQLEKKVA